MNQQKKEDHLAPFKKIDYRKIPGAIQGYVADTIPDIDSFIEDIEREEMIHDRINSIHIHDKEVVIKTKTRGTYHVRSIKGRMIFIKGES